MKKMRKLLYFITLSLAIISCSSNPTDEERAQVFLDNAKTFYDQKKLEAAKIELDSLHEVFPKLIAFRRQADTLNWHIELEEIARNLVYIDSMLPIKNIEVTTFQKSFVFEKDTKFQHLGNFVYNSLKTENNLQRNYLKPYVEEDGRMYIVSYYIGRAINHYQLKVSVDDLFAETLPVESTERHSYTDLGVFHETVLFQPDRLVQVPDFITLNKNEKLRITLIGTSNYSYYLSDLEKNAFVETYKLATLLADITQFKESQKRMIVRRELLNKKLKDTL